MKIKIKLLSATVFLLTGIFAAALGFNGFAVSANASAANSPAQVYAKNCARCHGADGKGETELGRLNDTPDLTVNKRSAKGTANIIKNGEGSMPAFGKKISAKDIAALVKYVRAL